MKLFRNSYTQLIRKHKATELIKPLFGVTN